MGCFCSRDDEQRSPSGKSYYLPTINESLEELGMPKFNPPIPKNQTDLLVQHIKKCEAAKPIQNSKVTLGFTGFVLGDADHGSKSSGTYRRLPTLYLNECRSPSLLKMSFETEEVSLLQREASLEKPAVVMSADSLSPPSSTKVKVENSTSLLSVKSTQYGKCFDYTENLEILLSDGEVIQGVKEIVLKMSVGDEVIAFIPSKLAFGDKGLENIIPPNANLVVQIVLKNILKP